LDQAKHAAHVVAALLGVSIAVSLSRPSSSRVANDIVLETSDASAVVARVTKMKILPAPDIDSGDEMFIGTGDFSNGSWVRP